MSLTDAANAPFDAHYEFGNKGYGDSITWKAKPATTDNGETAQVWGHKEKIPCFGQTLSLETEKGSALFQFQAVTKMKNPSDMFSAEVKQIDYRAKSKLQP